MIRFPSPLAALVTVLAMTAALAGCSSGTETADTEPANVVKPGELIAPYFAELPTAIRSLAGAPMPEGCLTNGVMPRERAVVEGMTPPPGVPAGALVRDVTGEGDDRLVLVDLRGPDAVFDVKGQRAISLDAEGLWLTRTDSTVDISVDLGNKPVVERFSLVGGKATPSASVDMPEGAPGPALFLTASEGHVYAAVVEQVVGEGQQQANLYRLDVAGKWERLTDFGSEGNNWVSVGNVERISTEGTPAILVTEQRGDAQGDVANLSATPVIVDAASGKVLVTGEAIPGDVQFTDLRADGSLVIEIPVKDGAVRIRSVEPERVLGCGRSGSRGLGLGEDPDQGPVAD